VPDATPTYRCAWAVSVGFKFQYCTYFGIPSIQLQSFLHNRNIRKQMLLQLKNKKPIDVTCYFLFYFLETQQVSGINMPIFRSMLLYCWTTTLAVLLLVCCVLEFGCGLAGVVSGLPAEASNPDMTPAELHPNSNTQQTKNKTANVIVQLYSRILLKMGILIPETCCESPRSKIKNSGWHRFSFLLFFNCHNDAWSNKHQMLLHFMFHWHLVVAMMFGNRVFL